MLALQLNEQKDSYSPGCKEAVFTHLCDIQARCSSAPSKVKRQCKQPWYLSLHFAWERERRWLHWQSSTHTQPATALQRENICRKYRDITTLLTALDWPIILKTRRPIRKRRARHPRHYWSVHWDWHPGEQFIELNHAVCLQDWGDTEGTGVCELLEFCQTKHRKTDMHTFQKIWANLQTLQSCIPNNSALLWLKNKRLCSL